MRFTKRLNPTGITFGTGRDNPKVVPVRKITIAQWQELFGVIQLLPQLLISVMSAPQSERTGFFVVALQESLEDILRIVALLTGLEEEWLHDNASLDELVAFFTETAKVNNFGELLKNVQGVLKLSGLSKVGQQADAR